MDKYIVRPNPKTFQITTTRNGHECMVMDLERKDGSAIQWRQTLASDKAWEYAAKHLRAMGWIGNDIDALDGVGTRDVEAVVEDDPKWGIQVKFINELGAKPAVASSRASVRDRMRVVASTLAAPVNPIAHGDDVPF